MVGGAGAGGEGDLQSLVRASDGDTARGQARPVPSERSVPSIRAGCAMHRGAEILGARNWLV